MPGCWSSISSCSSGRSITPTSIGADSGRGSVFRRSAGGSSWWRRHHDDPPALRLKTEPRPESAPIDVGVIERPDEHDEIDDQQPGIDAPVAGLDVTAPVVFHLLVVYFVMFVWALYYAYIY